MVVGDEMEWEVGWGFVGEVVLDVCLRGGFVGLVVRGVCGGMDGWTDGWATTHPSDSSV